jgi:hypothetical protein
MAAQQATLTTTPAKSARRADHTVSLSRLDASRGGSAASWRISPFPLGLSYADAE